LQIIAIEHIDNFGGFWELAFVTYGGVWERTFVAFGGLSF
jgi:hypothetical protein